MVGRFGAEVSEANVALLVACHGHDFHARHGDVTMDRAGAERIPSAERFSRVLRARRANRPGPAKLVQKLVGLEAKMKQLNKQVRDRTTNELKAMGYEVIPTQTNFFMVNVKKDVTPVGQEFEKKEIFDPLGMKSTSLGLGGRRIADLVSCAGVAGANRIVDRAASRGLG